MINEIRQEINLSPDLEKKINWAVKYASIQVKVQKGALIRLEPTNMAYLEPHKIEINNYVFLFLNGKDYFFINSYENQFPFSELSSQLKHAYLG